MARHSIGVLMFAGLLALAALGSVADAAQTTAPAAQPPSASPAPQAPPAQPTPKPAQSPWDLFKTAQALAEGNGVAKDLSRARDIFEKLMKSDNKAVAGSAALALSKLAAGELNDPALAARALDRGIELGDPWSMIAKAQSLASGSTKDQKEAIDLYLRAMKTAQKPEVDKAACYGLGQLYAQPGLLSFKQSLDYHTRAAALGNPWSLMAIGSLYEKGTGTKPSWKKAQDYYQKALASDVPNVRSSAAVSLARLYSQPGHDDAKRAIAYLTDAQKDGNPWATMALADRYARGSGVKKSTVTARRLLTELRDGQDEQVSRAAAAQLGRSYAAPGRFRDLKLAEQNLSYAAKRGDVWAAFSLAQLYATDLKSKANLRKARELLKTVAQSDDAKARSAAAVLLKKTR